MNDNNRLIVVEAWGFAFPNGIPQSFRNRREFLEDFVSFLQDDNAAEYSVRGCCRLYGIIHRPGKTPDNTFLSPNIRLIKKHESGFVMEISERLKVYVERADYNDDLRRLLLDFAREKADEHNYPKISRHHGHYLWHCHCKYGEDKNLLWLANTPLAPRSNTRGFHLCYN